MRMRGDEMYGEIIRRERKKHRIRQAELAVRIGVSTVTIGEWENERAKPSARNVARLQKELAIENNELLNALV